ncbi:MAG: TMEM165/GDT1 family protein [Candidatus Abyssobacteria bacterium SURF_17]|uniref:GDT1 family protein n=1 Tax=Candidatus Abyssobacteria bacterium SURF_17 TaxID=2093361 RepID=A0A419ETT5_9BACT|nr:MAG: TMEM165/GDT1 family protein [Candidatus Abyssubacteria bacterium SURF_17]
MDGKVIASVFMAVFLAELGDKTQLAILSFAAESKALVSVFVGAAAAMVTATVLAVVLGGVMAAYIPAKVVHVLAGTAFIVIGVLMLFGKL